MRILVVSQYFWPENFRINDLVTAWCERGHHVTVLTGIPNYPEGSVHPEFRDDPARFDQYGEAEVVRVPMRVRGQGKVALALNYLTFALSASIVGPARLKGREFDCIFVFEPSPITVGIPAAVLRRIKHAPVVFWVLDIWPDSLRAVGIVKSSRLLGLAGKLVGWIYRRCDVILAQSKSFVPKIRQLCSPDARVEYFPSWSEALFDGQDQSLAPELAPFEGQFRIVFAGNVGDAQDFPSILEAAERVKHRSDIQWIIVGDGRMLEWVKQEVTRRGLEANVALLGRFPLDRMPSFFAGADALLVSLKKADIFALTIPGKVQSYLASGKPLLAMLDGEGAQVVREAGAGLVVPAAEAESLAAQACIMADMSAGERQAMGENGKRHYREHFERDMLIARSEALLTEAIQRGIA